MTSKDKKRNSDKRKEKSRDAARCRRSKETEVFYELAQNLPLPSSVSTQLDKASIMRLTISFLKICKIREEKKWHDDEEQCEDGEIEKRLHQMYPKALEGFVLILSREADIVYLSENTAKYLGIQQIELMGQSIFDFTHPCDHDEIRDMMSDRPHGAKAVSEERTLFIRMKCTLTSKGKSVNLKSATYKVIKCTGRLVVAKMKSKKEADDASMYPYLLAVGEPIPHPANIEVPLDSSTFLSKHNMNMTFTYCDDRIQDLIGYNSENLIGRSLYNYHHALDSEVVEKAFKDLFAKGQTMTGQYRFLAKNGGYTWVITQGTIIHNNRTQKPQWVVCVHYVLSAVQEKNMILSDVQQQTADDLLSFKMEQSTDKIFGPRTKDMEQNYFVPEELKNNITLVNNEPADLSYLAPTAGDGCVQLGFPIYSQVADFACMDKDLPPPMCKEEPDPGPRDVHRSQELYSNNPSPASLSPRIQSPDEYQTIASPTDVDLMDKFFSTMDATQKSGSDSDMEDVDLNMRAPYIPMNADEDFSLVPPSTDSLFTLQSDFNPGLFGRTESVFMDKNAFEIPRCPMQPSVRDMIGGSTVVASIKQPPDTMLLQVKRPLDMNSLEKGPPVAKAVKRNDPRPLLGEGLPTKESVLLNLLLTGEDRNHGYKVNSTLQRMRGLKHDTLFTDLTRQDCEVNAPVQSQRLLQGEDLRQALDADCRLNKRNLAAVM
ncbi:hypoxia-inducible factor 1-alpha-like isoform X3 [Haliotis rufescens]|uniref:hypoxia-inducible factor 1-alpha-like isoform X3 n=1 Tax=Haliotis rufescens TaxID=6454 RepID=UPI001EB068FA|nr:hypoxia-inducible factor 1-alpha-like isoform X3 [Haliotis rufescens]